MVSFSLAVCLRSSLQWLRRSLLAYPRSAARAKLTLARLAMDHGHQADKGLSLGPVIAAPVFSLGLVWLAAKPVALIDRNKSRLAQSLAITISSRIGTQALMI